MELISIYKNVQRRIFLITNYFFFYKLRFQFQIYYNYNIKCFGNKLLAMILGGRWVSLEFKFFKSKILNP